MEAAELIAHAKQNPGKLSFASAGVDPSMLDTVRQLDAAEPGRLREEERRHRERDGCFRAFRANHWLGATLFAGVVLALA